MDYPCSLMPSQLGSPAQRSSRVGSNHPKGSDDHQKHPWSRSLTSGVLLWMQRLGAEENAEYEHAAINPDDSPGSSRSRVVIHTHLHTLSTDLTRSIASRELWILGARIADWMYLNRGRCILIEARSYRLDFRR